MIPGEFLDTTNILKIILIIVSAYVITKIIEKFLIKSVKKITKKKSATIYLQRFIKIIVYLSAFLMILWVFNIDITAAAAGLGVGAIVIGFGLKDIVSNWISGIIIIAEKIYRIDDVIRVGKITGVVRDISLRTTKLRTYDKNDVIIPNSMMLNEKIINLTIGKRESVASIIFNIDYTSDTDKAKKIIENILRKSEYVIVDEEKRREIRFVVSVEDWTTRIETLFWINKPFYEEFIKSKLTEEIKKKFDKNNILPPIGRIKKKIP